jgi:hypothetical protein
VTGVSNGTATITPISATNLYMPGKVTIGDGSSHSTRAQLEVLGGNTKVPLVHFGGAEVACEDCSGSHTESTYINFYRGTSQSSNQLLISHSDPMFIIGPYAPSGAAGINEPLLIGLSPDRLFWAHSDDDDVLIIGNARIAEPNQHIVLRSPTPDGNECFTVTLGVGTAFSGGFAVSVAEANPGNGHACRDSIAGGNETLVMDFIGAGDAANVGHVWFGPYQNPIPHAGRINIPNNEYIQAQVAAGGGTEKVLIGLSAADKLVTGIWTWPIADAPGCVQSDGSGNLSISACGGVSGSGTGGKIVKWTDTAVLGDSILTETAGKIDVGGILSVTDLKTTGSASGKNVVCVDTATGQLYASSTGTDCSN